LLLPKDSVEGALVVVFGLGAGGDEVATASLLALQPIVLLSY
jgi:hypothetical protein